MEIYSKHFFVGFVKERLISARLGLEETRHVILFRNEGDKKEKNDEGKKRAEGMKRKDQKKVGEMTK